MVEVNDTKVLFLAIWLHETYEAQAREVGWKTQESCRVKFDELPEANKKVMLKIARDICYNLELNKKEGFRECLVNLIKEMNECKLRTNCENSTSFWISKFEKRLKELDGGLKK